MKEENVFEKKLKIIKDNFMGRNAFLTVRHIDRNPIWEAIEVDIRNNFSNQFPDQIKCTHQWRDFGGYWQCYKCGKFGNATT